MRSLHPACVVSLLFVAAACGAPSAPARGDSGPTPGPGQTALTLEVGGGGWSGFTPHEEGAPLYVERGFQGGQHIAYSLRARGIADPPIHADVTAWLADPESDEVLLEERSIGLLLDDPEPGMYEHPPPEGVTEALAILYLIDDPTPALSRRAALRVRVLLEDGRTAEASMEGYVEWAPGDAP